VTPTNRLFEIKAGLTTNFESVERFPWGHYERYTDVGLLLIGLCSV